MQLGGSGGPSGTSAEIWLKLLHAQLRGPRSSNGDNEEVKAAL